MASQQVGLKKVELVWWDPHVGQLPEAGVDAVNRLPGSDRSLNNLAPPEQGSSSLGCHPNLGGIASDADHIGDGERLSVENTS